MLFLSISSGTSSIVIAMAITQIHSNYSLLNEVLTKKITLVEQ
jgi:hypothetical protein